MTSRSPVTALCTHADTLWASVTNLGRIEVWRLPEDYAGAAVPFGKLAGAHGGVVVGVAVEAGMLFSASFSHNGEHTLVARQLPWAV